MLHTQNLTIEEAGRFYLECEVGYFYSPPEDPGGFGRHRVGAEVEIKHIHTLVITTETKEFRDRHDDGPWEEADEAACVWLNDNLDRVQEELIEKHDPRPE